MGKYEAIAHTIIDVVEEAIRKAHPEIEQFFPEEDEDGSPINTLLYGEAYYNLENEVVEILRDINSELREAYDKLTETWKGKEMPPHGWFNFVRVLEKQLKQ